MEAVAESDKTLIVLDRPNPNAHLIDGPIMKKEHSSFIGMHPIPIVYGMTIGEYAKMINGEGWLDNGESCKLEVVPVANYTHQSRYILPIPPSPNLPNERAVLLYPSLCLLEGTIMSEGRGTNMQFQVYGHPEFKEREFSYTPRSMSSSKYPKHQDNLCYGRDLRQKSLTEIRNRDQLDLSYLIDAFHQTKPNSEFFLENNFFYKLSGNTVFKEQLIQGVSVEEIRESWRPGLEEFKKTRSLYLLYP